MKLKRLIISLLAVLMLVSGCSAQGPSNVVKQFTEDELVIIKALLERRDYRDAYAIDIVASETKVNAIKAHSFIFGDAGLMREISALSALESSHDDYLKDPELGYPVYGPIVFDESTVYGEGDSLFFIVFIDGNAGTFRVQSCERVELKNRTLNVEIGIHLSKGGNYMMTPTYIIVEI